MCGIFGYVCKEEYDKRLDIALPILALYMQDRGEHSWGFSDGEIIEKNTGPISDAWSLALTGRNKAIYHTRFATTGARTKENSHPFEFGEGENKIIGQHNGMVSNHDELNKEYGRKFAVDSMHIFQHIFEGKPTREIKGYGAISYFQKGRLNLCRFNSGQLAIARTSFGTVFASTQESITTAMKMAGINIETFYQVDEDRLYYADETGLLYEDKEHPLMFGTRYTTSYGSGYGGYSRGHYHDDDWRGGGSEKVKPFKSEKGYWDGYKYETGRWEGETFIHGDWNGDKFTPNKVKCSEEALKLLGDGKKGKKKNKVINIKNAAKHQQEADACAICQVDFGTTDESHETPIGELCDSCNDIYWNSVSKDNEDLKKFVENDEIDAKVGEGLARVDDPFTATTVRLFIKGLRPTEVDDKTNVETGMTGCDECNRTMVNDDTIFVDEEKGRVRWVLCQTCHTELTTPFRTNTSFDFPSA